MVAVMRFGVLGAVAAWTSDGRPVTIPGLKVRALLAALLINEGRPASADQLIERLWGDDPPGNPSGALSVKVSQLRRALEDAEPGGRRLVVSPPPGYRLHADADSVDAQRFQALTARARQTEDPRSRAALLSDALALWRGPAFADFSDEDFTRATITRLEEQRLTAIEDLAEARLALGEHAALAGELTDLLVQYPLRERPRALHMLALYRSGRQTEALSSYEAIRVHLADELGLDPGAELTDLHVAMLSQDPRLNAPSPSELLAAADRPATNLPAAVTELIGRDEAVTEIRALLEQRRLVTLTGSGGVGKTRLAVEAATPLIETFTDGVWLIELAAFDRPGTPDAMDSLAEMVMTVLGIRDSAAMGEPWTSRDRLAGGLRTRHVLLVLDNCEHVIEQVAELTSFLLHAVPGLRVLTTSREPLGLAGEVVWPVPPLEVPGPAGKIDLAVLERSSAVRLFVARAAAAAHTFTLNAGNADAVAVLCRRLDGIPLALELAATRVRALGMRGLIAGLDDRFRLLATGHRGAPPRQQTLMAMIDWSWQLLTAAERVVLRRLAVHADGCTQEAAEAVCAANGVPPEEVLDILARLVDRSLVVMSERDDDGPQYRLLESVAAYCVERMHEAGELLEVRRLHYHYYAGLAERAEPHLYGPGQQRWLQRLDAEAANMRTALENAMRQGAADLALRLVNSLSWYWFLRGRLAEAKRSLQAALSTSGEASPAGRAKATGWHAGISFLLGDIADWPARHEAALGLYADVEDARAQARAEWFLAYAEIDLGDVAATEILINRALDAFRGVGDEWGVAAALSIRAKHAYVKGDAAALEDDATRSVAMFRRLGDRWGLLQANEWLAAHADMTGDFERAIAVHRDGLRMAEELGLWPDVAGRLSWLGWSLMQRGDYSAAREHCGLGLRLAEEQGSPLGVIFAQMGLAFAARRDGKLDIAEEHLTCLLEAAESRDAERGQPLHTPSVLVELGYLEVLRGNAEAARARHLRAFAIAQQLGAVRDMVQAVGGLAAASALGGCHQQAAQLLGAAAAARESLQTPLTPADKSDVCRTTVATRAALGDDIFDAAHDQGRKLQLEDAVQQTCAG
ncbi:BTAD domain-containing putative transcriptional regulator [Dactylosporangium cerinum]